MSITPLQHRDDDRRSENLRLGIRLVVLSVSAFVAGCAGRAPAPKATPSAPGVLEIREGLASYYAQEFHGKRTASGARFDMDSMVAAHPTYPFGTLVRVTNLTNRRAVRLRIQDRGPAPRAQADGVIIDLSRRAAQALGFLPDGRARVRLEVLSWGINRPRR